MLKSICFWCWSSIASQEHSKEWKSRIIVPQCTKIGTSWKGAGRRWNDRLDAKYCSLFSILIGHKKKIEDSHWSNNSAAPGFHRLYCDWSIRGNGGFSLVNSPKWRLVIGQFCKMEASHWSKLRKIAHHCIEVGTSLNEARWQVLRWWIWCSMLSLALLWLVNPWKWSLLIGQQVGKSLHQSWHKLEASWQVLRWWIWSNMLLLLLPFTSSDVKWNVIHLYHLEEHNASKQHCFCSALRCIFNALYRSSLLNV